MSQRKKWGIALLVWPVAAFILSFVLYGVVNWVFSSAAEPLPGGGSIADGVDAASGDPFGPGSAATTIINVILFIMGAAAVFLGLPSIIVGIVLLATSGTSQPSAAAERTPAQSKKGLSIASMVLGISSIVLWFIGFIPAVLAIIFGAIGLKKSQGKGFALAGLITGIVGVILSFVFLIMITVVSYNGVSSRAQDSSVQADASTVAKKAELYWADNDSYPTFDQMERVLAGTGIDISPQGDGLGGDVVYIPCYGDGAIIWYWSNSDDEYGSLYVGTTDVCEWN